MIKFKEFISEKLDPKKHDAGDYVKDFKKSKAPQFKGKSPEKRRKMAIAAYLDAKDKMDEGSESWDCLLYTSPSPRDLSTSRMPSSA